MSRLYNTLEKIRIGEQGVSPPKKPAPAAEISLTASKSRRLRFVLLGLSCMLGLALLLFFAGPKRKDAKPDASLNAAATNAAAPVLTPGQLVAQAPSRPDVSARMPAEVPVPRAPSATSTGSGLYLQLNNKGTALVHENQHWQGIYYFEQARKQQPERPEALINMAVALAELGLRAPAKRLFTEAYGLAPNHPLLRKNLDLLGQMDFFDDQWVASLFAGATEPLQGLQSQ
ncbi:MAG: tetratricopeptide repeat protein [Syntrophaceae bacterium]|nr:tetratricopeptide repeat protein [Syntrophaceae bacterium]